MLRGNLAADLTLNHRSRSAATRRFSFEPIRLASLPTEWLVVCGVIVLPALGAWTLRKSLAEVVPYEAESLTRERRRMLLRDMGRPVFCVCAIGFVWKMIGYVVPQGNLGSFEGIMLGMSCATLVVAAIELFTERGFDMLRVYQVIFPLITGVFLLPSCPQCRKKAPCLRRSACRRAFRA